MALIELGSQSPAPQTPEASGANPPPQPSALDFLPPMSKIGLEKTFTDLGLTQDEIVTAVNPLLPAFQSASERVRTGPTSPLVGVAEKALRTAHQTKFGFGLVEHMDRISAKTRESVGEAEPPRPARKGLLWWRGNKTP